MLIRKDLYLLTEWLQQANRKPLIMRGVRQVGKTALVRELAKQHQKKLIEINFEERPQARSWFASNDIQQIWSELETLLPEPAKPESCLLFLDEVQAAPDMLAKLRWFYEKLPELPVIAAGSLLDFVLSDHTFSMPVGRVQYFYVEPLSFFEFLVADKQLALVNYLQQFTLEKTISEATHQTLMQYVENYCLIGGMPESVKTWITEHSYLRVNQAHHDLMTSYQDDFAKYPARISSERLHELLLAIPRMLGNKFIYSHVNPDVKSQTVANALLLLTLARITHVVQAVAGDGVPLGAKQKQRYFKVILCDVGLMHTSVNPNPNPNNLKPLTLSNNGAIAEQLAGQMLRKNFQFYQDPQLYYWLREGQSNAEVDYLIQHHDLIIPVEVKAGSVGALRSLHYFMHLRQLKLAVRIDSGNVSVTEVDVKLTTGERVVYRLLSIPFYLVEQLPILLEEISLKFPNPPS